MQSFQLALNLQLIPQFSKKGHLLLMSTISKIFTRIICIPRWAFFDWVLSRFQGEFRRKYSRQHCILTMLELSKEAVDKNKAFDVLITDLSKVFHCLSHKLLIAKLDAYGLELLFLKVPLCEKSPYSELFWSIFSRIRNECGELIWV